MGRKNGDIGVTDSSSLYHLKQIYEKLLSLYPEAKEELQLFSPVEKDLSVQHINLPDADDGYGMLEWADGNFSYEIRGDNYRWEQKKRMSKRLFTFARGAYEFMTSEYSVMLPISRTYNNAGIVTSPLPAS